MRRSTPQEVAAALAAGRAGETFLLVAKLARPKRDADRALRELVRLGFRRALAGDEIELERLELEVRRLKPLLDVGLIGQMEYDNEALAREVLEIVPRFALKEGVVAIGEIGYDEITEAEEKAYQWQLQFAKDHDMVVMVHSPHRDKKRGIIRSLDVAKEVGIDMEKLVIDHNNEETVEDVLDAGAWAAFTIYPHTKMGSQRMVEIVKQYGSDRIIIDSSADWGVSDPLSVPRTAKLMLEQGVDEATVEKTTWQNALDAYAQSGQIDVEALLSTPVIDQRQLFHDNSVLRGQEPQVDEAVPN